MKKMIKTAAFTVIAAFAINAASAQTTVDGASGQGWASKGDVQLTLGLNNAGLQALTPAFTLKTVSIVETEWTCTKITPQGKELTQERSRETRTTVQGVVSSTARVKNQITGFYLNGWSGSPTISVHNNGGPAVGSCPNGWTADEPRVNSYPGNGGGFFVNDVQIQNAVIL